MIHLSQDIIMIITLNKIKIQPQIKYVHNNVPFTLQSANQSNVDTTCFSRLGKYFVALLYSLLRHKSSCNNAHNKTKNIFILFLLTIMCIIEEGRDTWLLLIVTQGSVLHAAVK